MLMRDLLHVAGQNAEIRREQFQQFSTARRSRGQDERRQFHDFILSKSVALSSP
jgi:hypothetical protein